MIKTNFYNNSDEYFAAKVAGVIQLAWNIVFDVNNIISIILLKSI